MANVQVQYFAIYGMVDTPDSPSAIARFTQCKDPAIHKYEICNAKRSWFEEETPRHVVYKFYIHVVYKFYIDVLKLLIECMPNFSMTRHKTPMNLDINCRILTVTPTEAQKVNRWLWT